MRCSRHCARTTIPPSRRDDAAWPPCGLPARVRAVARTQEVAHAFLREAAEAAAGLPEAPQVMVYPPVPMAVQRVANVERAQMVVESTSRPALQRFLANWQPLLHGVRPKGLIRWAIDVDPLAI